MYAVKQTEGQAPQHGVQSTYSNPGPKGRQHEAHRETCAKSQDGNLEPARHQKCKGKKYIRRLKLTTRRMNRSVLSGGSILRYCSRTPDPREGFFEEDRADQDVSRGLVRSFNTRGIVMRMKEQIR